MSRGSLIAAVMFLCLAAVLYALVIFTAQGDPITLGISSPAFNPGERIPVLCTCDGTDISPRLSWRGAPAGVKTYALIMDDPDSAGGTFTHWVIFNVPGDAMGLPENVPKDGSLDDGAVQGKNDFGNTGYNGPCPPAGKTHHYTFHLYALDTVLSLNPGASASDVRAAIQGHILARGELMGTYSR